MSNIKQLTQRHISKEFRLTKVNNKKGLIDRLIYILDKELPNDIETIGQFKFNFHSDLVLLNSDFYIYYKSFETSEECKERLIKEQTDIRDKVALLKKLAIELNYKLEKVND